MADLAYPTACVHCQAFCDGPGPLCPDCDAKLHELSMAAACAHCAMPVAQADAPCPRCLGKGFYPYERVGRLCIYDDPIRTVIKQFKYHRRWPLGEWLTDRLLDQLRTQTLLKQIDLIIPVPLHRRRQFSRGYNQAKVIAARISKEKKINLIQPLRRIRNTEQQTAQTSQKARHANVRDAFALRDAKSIEGKRILVVDDVLTTGATLQAVGRTLLAAKPASLSAVVLAVADPRHRDFLTI
ncbi:MAG TPA: ComF family protein [Tepidisphaeraceae bacterium]|jgi:ComF family protein|nr:ComF family protein [Tepidisphaeraceae bacterium]